MSRQWNGHGIQKEVYDWMTCRVPQAATILELGSGDVSTRYLTEDGYGVVSVESDERLLGRYPSRYLQVPMDLTTDWYDAEELARQLHGVEYDLLLIDGPHGHRGQLVNHLALFNLDVPVVVHDTDRASEALVVGHIAARTGRVAKFFPMDLQFAVVDGCTRFDLTT